MADVKIFTSKTCGWAVRNYASLLEKGVEFDTVCPHDARGNKTAEFSAVTPFRKTPVLIHGKTSVFESTLINVYIDDRFPDPPLLPDNPADRIEAHKWIHFAEAGLMTTLSAIASAGELCERRARIQELADDLHWFVDHAMGNDWVGPYFFGDVFSLTDIAFFTVFRTLRQIEEELQTTIAALPPSIASWERNIMARPSLRQAVDIQEDMPF